MRVGGVVCCLLVATSVAAAPAHAMSGADLVQACRDNGGPDCTGLDHLLRLPASQCRKITPSEPCKTIDGREIDEDAVSSYEDSWVPRALALQRGLDDTNPLQEELWTHTHNSFNAEAYQPTFHGLDPNQIYSITDQLRMGIRAIEMDVHWAPSTSGDPANGGYDVLVCHGGLGFLPVQDHVGCGVNDPLFTTRLAEFAGWVKTHPGEVVILYLENNLADDIKDPSPAYQKVAAELDAQLGSLVYKPDRTGFSSTQCTPFPVDVSRAQIRSLGKQVILVGECGAGPWLDWVHVQGPRWKQSGLAEGDDFDATRCAADRTDEDYASNWIRHWGDETGLSHGARMGGDVTTSDATAMVRCGVNMIGLDNLVPFDPRMEALVWSWAEDQPSAGAGCAYVGADGRFHKGSCSTPRRVACRTPAGTWVVPTPKHNWDMASNLCGGAASFAVPRTGYDDELLKDATGGVEVWVDYRNAGSGWVAG